MFMMRFIAGNVLCALLAGAILLVKKIFAGKLPVKCQYRIWLIFLAYLGVLWLPGSVFRTLGSFWSSAAPSLSHAPSGSVQDVSTISGSSWMQDFSQSVSRIDLSFLSLISGGIWAAGIALYLFFFFLNAKKLHVLKKTGKEPDTAVADLFRECKACLLIHRNISLLESDVYSPLTYGLFHPVILIPFGMAEQFSLQEIRHILLHELIHIRHRDLYLNYILSFFRILYWFNPAVRAAFRHIRLDREIWCDHAVMKNCRESEVLDYGYTLLHFARLMQPSFSHDIRCQADSREQLKIRLQCIARFSPSGKETGRMGMAALALSAFLALFFLSFLHVFAAGSDRYTPEKPLSVRETDLSRFFKETRGCFAAYSFDGGEYLIYNEKMSRTRYSPDSTYKIYAALNAQENSVITPDHQTRRWDGQNYGFDAWNQDQNLGSAMRNSVNWYFQDLDRELGKKEIADFLARIHYGNCSVTGSTDDFWLESSLKISPLEQVVLLRQLYDNTMGFDERNVETVKGAMYLEENETGALYAKTGSGKVNGKEIRGWFTGWLETGSDTVFFAVYIEGSDGISGSQAAEIGKNILKSLDF